MGRLEGKVAVITGAASGIGEGTARKFAGEGARVVLADIDQAGGERLVEELGTSAVFLKTDVANEGDVQAAVARAVERWGRLDCMFNNAGFGGITGPIELTDMAGYDQTMAVLLRGVFVGIKHAAAVMKAQGSGSIISTASIAGIEAGYGPHAYSAAKAAVIQLTRTAAMELGPFGVRVNAVCPGFVMTNIFTPAGALFGMDPETFHARLGEQVANWPAIKRPGEPADIANAVAWLASEEASYVTGQAIVVDGGLTAGRSLDELWMRMAQAAGIDPAVWAQMRQQG